MFHYMHNPDPERAREKKDIIPEPCDRDVNGKVVLSSICEREADIAHPHLHPAFATSLE